MVIWYGEGGWDKGEGEIVGGGGGRLRVKGTVAECEFRRVLLDVHDLAMVRRVHRLAGRGFRRGGCLLLRVDARYWGEDWLSLPNALCVRIPESRRIEHPET